MRLLFLLVAILGGARTCSAWTVPTTTTTTTGLRRSKRCYYPHRTLLLLLRSLHPQNHDNIDPAMTFYDEAAVEEDGITTIDMSAVVDVAAVSTSARRRKDRLTTSTTFTRTTTTTMTSMILLLLFSIFGTPLAATAGLLDDYGTDPKKMVDNTANKNGVAAGVVVAKPKADVAIDPTLRGSYYYPTAKKRYLPRILKVSNEIALIPNALVDGDWATVADFGKVAENAILPLQLYQSSLDGQGLSMNNAYAKIMKQDALQYEKAYQVFAKAVKQQNLDSAQQAVSEMGVAIADYRTQGRLSDDDGNIPSVDEMRRMAMRRQTGSYDKY